MPALTTSITFGSVLLDGGSGGNYIERLTPTKVPGSLKQVFNENVTITEIPGRTKEWQVDINGFLSGGNRDADEDTLETYNNGSVRQFIDGKHNGNYVIMSLEFPKENRGNTLYPYRMTIRQYKQTLP